MVSATDAQLNIPAEETFSIAHKQYKFNGLEDIASVLDDLKKRTNLKKVDLSGNSLGVECSKLLSEALEAHRDTLVEIDLSDLYTARLNTEIPQSLSYILPTLVKFPNLIKINLSDNAIGLQAIEPVESYLAEAVALQHLILSNNGMGPFAGARIGTSLFKLAKAKADNGITTSLKTFVCGRNRLENGSINHLSVGLRNHKDLEIVRLYQNGIRPAGIAKLVSQGLSHNSSLKVLDLQDNTVTTVGADQIAIYLGRWPKLVEINFNDSLLKPRGSLLVSKALSEVELPLLKSVRLQYNELEADALEVIATTLSKGKLPKLTLLELNGNRFEEESEFVDQIKETFETRGEGELDELDELEEIDSDEDEDDDEDDDESQDALEEDLDLDQLEKELSGLSVDEGKDASVDDLAAELSKTHLK
ncbi:uncharacterized protein KQ657_004873 [Scheffersomyces spartinae]|uniref:Ran GTPase-activating protein 1 n=1 Tax=Scheffersomyces spartinae TaxID=45513 RepID=A0A9P7VAE6_9ASCO|nr:uncharacterized protein KQ657_004873 [Scheffersomyces spartinae]KAG7194165.1 hypothetical protein KQ657_004873 [Scheffersomyces spartinae]